MFLDNETRAPHRRAPLSARVLMGVALVLFALGSFLVGSLWIVPQPPTTITYQSQYDAAAYGIGLIWPVVLFIVCAVATMALVSANAGARTLLLLWAIGIALYFIPNMLVFRTGYWASVALPLQGMEEAVLIAALAVLNGAAIVGAWRLVFRHTARPPVDGSS